MTDTELLTRCSWCGSTDVRQIPGVYTRKWETQESGKGPVEKQLPVFRRGECGRLFNELEGKRIFSWIPTTLVLIGTIINASGGLWISFRRRNKQNNSLRPF